MAAFAQRQDVDMGFLKSLIQRGNEALMQERGKKIRLGLDDKILLGWNALMNAAYSKATSIAHLKRRHRKVPGFFRRLQLPDCRFD